MTSLVVTHIKTQNLLNKWIDFASFHLYCRVDASEFQNVQSSSEHEIVLIDIVYDIVDELKAI